MSKSLKEDSAGDKRILVNMIIDLTNTFVWRHLTLGPYPYKLNFLNS